MKNSVQYLFDLITKKLWFFLRKKKVFIHTNVNKIRMIQKNATITGIKHGLRTFFKNLESLI